MKIFLITCIAAMVSAGVYGTLDLVKDISQGTLIQYEKESVHGSFAVSNKNLSQIADLLKVETNKRENARPNVSDLKVEYFSRGEPPHFSTLEELMLSDSTALINDSAKSIQLTNVTEIKADTEKVIAVLPPKEERKFSPKLFSRSKPRPTLRETVITHADTSKKQ